MAAEMDLADWGDVADEVDVSKLQHPDELTPKDSQDVNTPSAADEYFEAIVPKKGPYKLFLSNLSFKVTDELVKKHFEEKLEVKVTDVYLMTKENGKFSGRAFVTVATRDNAITVLKLERFEVNGRMCNVELAENKGSGGRRSRDSRGPRRDGDRSRREGDSRGPRRDGDRSRREGDSRGPRRDGDRSRRHGYGRDGAPHGSAFSSSKRSEDNLADMPPPPGPRRRGAGAEAVPDAALQDKWSMKGGALTTDASGRPRLNLLPRSAPVPDMPGSTEGGAPAGAEAATGSFASGSKRHGKSRGHGKGRGRGAKPAASKDGWMSSEAHSGGRRGKAAPARKVQQPEEEQPEAKAGGGTMFDVLGDSDSDCAAVQRRCTGSTFRTPPPASCMRRWSMNATRTCVRPSDTLHLCRRGLHLNANRPLAMAATASTPAQLVLKVKKLSEHAILPVRGSLQAAGYDLASAYDGVVPARGKALLKTDLACIIPDGCYGRIAPRSGLAWKHSIDVGAGVIDADYRGNVGVILFNFSEKDFSVKAGDRIAQLILERIAVAEVQEVDDLEASERGSGGFGSTGVAKKARTDE